VLVEVTSRNKYIFFFKVWMGARGSVVGWGTNKSEGRGFDSRWSR
jgi:hypothetical protein